MVQSTRCINFTNNNLTFSFYLVVFLLSHTSSKLPWSKYEITVRKTEGMNHFGDMRMWHDNIKMNLK